MTGPELAALVTAFASALIALIAVRRAPAEVAKTQAEARHQESSAAVDIATVTKLAGETWAGMVKELKEEIAEARAEEKEKDVEFKAQLDDYRLRLQNSESRAERSDQQAERSRSDIVNLGEEFVKARKEYEDNMKTMAGFIVRLIVQVKDLGGKPDIDMQQLDKLAKIVQLNIS